MSFLFVSLIVCESDCFFCECLFVSEFICCESVCMSVSLFVCESDCFLVSLIACL